MKDERSEYTRRTSDLLLVCVSVLNLGSIFDDDVQSVQSESRQSLPWQPAQMKAPPSFSERLLEVYQPPFQPSSTPSHLQNRFMVRIITPSSPYTLPPLTSSSPHTLLSSLPPLLTPSSPHTLPSLPHQHSLSSLSLSLTCHALFSPPLSLFPSLLIPNSVSLVQFLTLPPPHLSTGIQSGGCGS